MRARSENGGNTLVFPQRGDPPPVQAGYFRDPGDPYVQHKVWVDCVQRTVALTCLPCKNKQFVPYCKIKKVSVDQIFCEGCSEIKHEVAQ